MEPVSPHLLEATVAEASTHHIGGHRRHGGVSVSGGQLQVATTTDPAPSRRLLGGDPRATLPPPPSVASSHQLGRRHRRGISPPRWWWRRLGEGAQKGSFLSFPPLSAPSSPALNPVDPRLPACRGLLRGRRGARGVSGDRIRCPPPRIRCVADALGFGASRLGVGAAAPAAVTCSSLMRAVPWPDLASYAPDLVAIAVRAVLLLAGTAAAASSLPVGRGGQRDSRTGVAADWRPCPLLFPPWLWSGRRTSDAAVLACALACEGALVAAACSHELGVTVSVVAMAGASGAVAICGCVFLAS